MSILRARNAANAHRGKPLPVKSLLRAVCTLVLLPGLSASVRAEDPASGNLGGPSNQTSPQLSGWVESVREEAADRLTDFTFDHLEYLKLEPSTIEFNWLVLTHNLQLVIQQRDAIADNIRFLNFQLKDATADTFSVRSIASDLQSQLSQAHSSFDFARYTASSYPVAGIDYHLKFMTATANRVYDLQDSLSQARATLDQASRVQNDLQIQRTFTYGGLGLSEVNVGVARTNLGVFDAVAPHVNFTIDAAQNLYGWSGVVQEGIQLTYPMQPADFNYHANKFSFDAGATLVSVLKPASAEMLGGAMGLYDLHEKWRDLNDALVAQQHQRETQTLAFGGVLSTANLPRISFAPTPVDLTSGGSFRSDSNDRLSITGVWVTHNDVNFDRFNAASRYTFNGLDTPSGHVLTGYGIVSRDRTEMNQPFSFSSLFDTRDTQNVTETTRRFESYNDSFNGALANQRIQQAAEFNSVNSLGTQRVLPPPRIDIPFNMPPLHLVDDSFPKKKPDIFLPPPGPPPFLPAVIQHDPPEGLGAASVSGGPSGPRGGVAMPATVVNSKPTDKADTSDIFGSGNGK